jgi:cation transport regulator ChaC
LKSKKHECHASFRYTRALARVSLVDGRSVDALVYSATRENPHFVPELAKDTEDALEAAASIIAVSSGPSGENAPYLSMLADAIPDDAYLAALNAKVLAKKLAIIA